MRASTLFTIFGSIHGLTSLRKTKESETVFDKRKNMKEKLNQFLDGCGLSGIWTSTSFKTTKDRENRCASLTDKLIEVSGQPLFTNAFWN